MTTEDHEHDRVVAIEAEGVWVQFDPPTSVRVVARTDEAEGPTVLAYGENGYGIGVWGPEPEPDADTAAEG